MRNEHHLRNNAAASKQTAASTFGVLLEVEALHAALLQMRLALLVNPQMRVVKVLRLLVSIATCGYNAKR